MSFTGDYTLSTSDADQNVLDSANATSGESNHYEYDKTLTVAIDAGGVMTTTGSGQGTAVASGQRSVLHWTGSSGGTAYSTDIRDTYHYSGGWTQSYSESGASTTPFGSNLASGSSTYTYGSGIGESETPSSYSTTTSTNASPGFGSETYAIGDNPFPDPSYQTGGTPTLGMGEPPTNTPGGAPGASSNAPPAAPPTLAQQVEDINARIAYDKAHGGANNAWLMQQRAALHQQGMQNDGAAIGSSIGQAAKAFFGQADPEVQRVYSETVHDRAVGTADAFVSRLTSAGHFIAPHLVDKQSELNTFAYDAEERANAAGTAGIIIDSAAIAISIVDGVNAFKGVLNAASAGGAMLGGLFSGNALVTAGIANPAIAIQGARLLANIAMGSAGAHDFLNSVGNPGGGGSGNAAEYEQLKKSLRAQMGRPVASDPELDSLLSKLYRDNAQVGSGSTAAAVREELATGKPVGGVFHTQKAQEAIVALQRWLAKHPSASPGDVAAAENVIRDMINALNGD